MDDEAGTRARSIQSNERAVESCIELT